MASRSGVRSCSTSASWPSSCSTWSSSPSADWRRDHRSRRSSRDGIVSVAAVVGANRLLEGNGMRRLWITAVAQQRSMLGAHLSDIGRAPALAAHPCSHLTHPPARCLGALLRFLHNRTATSRDTKPWLGKNIYNTTGHNQTVTKNEVGSYLDGEYFVFKVAVQNDGSTSDRFKVSAPGSTYLFTAACRHHRRRRRRNVRDASTEQRRKACDRGVHASGRQQRSSSR